MNLLPNSLSKQRMLFLSGITIIYIALLVSLDFLQGSFWHDELSFWDTSLYYFGDSLIPSIDDLRSYGELNTPLPFMIFGALEYLFGGGIFAGRLLNLILSLMIVFIIGWPDRNKGSRAILCLIGLLLCPYYLWLSGHLYTEMIACSWVVLGFMGYVHNRHLLSAIAFVLAIASRQYMLAFPVAIFTYEFVIATTHAIRLRKLNIMAQWRWLAPLVSVSSIGIWFYLFDGLAPDQALSIKAPGIQRSIFSLRPGVAINFLAIIGLYIVIPEFILFRPGNWFEEFKQHKRKFIFIAIGLLLWFFVFPPSVRGHGNIIKIAEIMPAYLLKYSLFYGLSLIVCWRFFRPNLMLLIVLFNCLIMMKAIPWDRYALPLIVVFWYLKSLGLEDKFNIFDQQINSTAMAQHDLE